VISALCENNAAEVARIFALQLVDLEPIEAAKAAGRECGKELPRLCAVLHHVLLERFVPGEVALLLEMIRVAGAGDAARERTMFENGEAA
jgi:hypothetical protein